MLGQPPHQEVEPAAPALRTHEWPPPRPVRDEPPEAEEPDDLRIRRVFEQADRGPALVQPPERLCAVQQAPEGRLVDVVIPDVRQHAHSRHPASKLTLLEQRTSAGPDAQRALSSIARST